jgi:hypothetical protein
MSEHQPVAPRCCGRPCAETGRFRLFAAMVEVNDVLVAGFAVVKAIYRCAACGKRYEVDVKVKEKKCPA